ncbi:ABC transporter ATP-binding protein [Lacticaseibacillus rhamnosus]|uniref:ABC transporter ATP-binding protein n=1 Tax=Lacticaseibacillus rhamnosus TaxID=47715 RepID=UPI001BD4DD25|nr:ABC transporter ATP-binding protein [Lacticaseibacillus rhamnosus]MBS9785991.1 ABC transporter ATP-binding protein [Lacticaseibacillus rhamnosus]MCH5391986.1 ABC transporter ATP-binding protein [Lacticaseibacillus rhamnosus]
MLEVNHIAKSFKGNTVLTDVSLQVKAGQLIHISGANGSGKSTLFKIITKLLEPDHGSVRIGKDDLIGALIENPGFLEFESMMTNLRFLANLNNRFDQSYTLQLVKQFGLNPTNRQAISKYSVGMRQKVGIIQAVMEHQSLILLDEPTRGLDKASIEQFIVLIDALINDGKSVMIASHDDVPGLMYDLALRPEDGRLAQ